MVFLDTNYDGKFQVTKSQGKVPLFREKSNSGILSKERPAVGMPACPWHHNISGSDAFVFGLPHDIITW